MTNSLTISEQTELATYEGVIERGLNTFVEVGNALMAIRDARLYRECFGTFEDYCRERWGWSKTHANRLIQSTEVVNNLTPVGVKPENERQIRPLASLEADHQREAWQAAVATAPNGKVTAAHVEKVVQEFVAPNRLAVHFSSESEEWATPQDLFSLLDQEFNFTLDVCASEWNAKCADYFGPEIDGLKQEWRGACWMNPPYGNEIKQWVQKAYEAGKQGSTVVCLIPARTDTDWWWNYCIKGEVRFLHGRVSFERQNGKADSAPFPSAVVIFRQKDVTWPKDFWWEKWNR